MAKKKKKRKKKITFAVPHSRVRNDIRKLWMWSPNRSEAVKQAKIAPGRYQCMECGEHLTTKEIQVDHIEPVGPTPGSRNATEETTWDVFLDRMFVDPSGLRVLCDPCHKDKS